MRHLVLTLGLLVLPTKQKESLPTPLQPLTPYIQTIKQTKTLKITKPKSLVDALILVESAGNEHAFNKKENAVGCLQIRPVMVREVNRILRNKKSSTRYTKKDRWDCGKSKEMFYIWRSYHHKVSNDETIARNWNGGPKGYKKQSTEHYWGKVQKIWAN